MEHSEFIMMSMPGELRLSAHGTWFHADERVTHEGLISYLYRHLELTDATATESSAAQWILLHNGKAVPVIVEDTGYFVRSIDTLTNPWSAILSDDSSESLDLSQLRVGGTNEFYARVKNNRFDAKLLRSAWQALLPHIEERSGLFFINCSGHSEPIRSYVRTGRI